MVLMNTLSSRVQAWSGLTLSTLLFLTSLIAFLTHPSPKSIRSYNADSHLNITSVQPVYGRSIWHLDRHLQEFLEVQWSFKGDFTRRSARALDDDASPLGSLWTWNTKQLYLSLVVQWVSPADGAHHEAVVWDRIIRRKEDAMELRWDQQGNKYGVRELTRKWSTIPSARFTLKWNAMPKVGLLAYGNEATSGEIAIPARVITERELEEGRKHTGRKMPY